MELTELLHTSQQDFQGNERKGEWGKWRKGKGGKKRIRRSGEEKRRGRKEMGRG